MSDPLRVRLLGDPPPLPRSADLDVIYLARLARVDLPADDARLTRMTAKLSARTGADLGHVAVLVAGLAAKLEPEEDMAMTLDCHLARCRWLSVEDL